MNGRFFEPKTKETRRERAFTLIELLVVVAIVGVLSSVVISSLNTARAKARDARRLSDLRQIRTAIDFYYADNGYYPPSSCGWDCNGYFVSHSDSSWNSFKSHLSPYISSLPKDPVNSNCSPWTDNCHSYAYGNVMNNSATPNYDLVTQFEDKNNPLRCELKSYKFALGGGGGSWCGAYSKHLYDAYQ